MLNNLLARIHRDVGQHTTDVGLKRSVQDADDIVVRLMKVENVKEVKMIFFNTTADKLNAELNGNYVVVRASRRSTEFLNFTLDRENVKQLIKDLTKCDKDWPES